MPEKKKQSKTGSYDAVENPQQPLKKSRKQQEQDIDTWRTALSGQILAQSSSSSESINANWLDNLKDDSLHFLEKETGGRREQLKQEQLNKQAIEVTVDRLFSCLQGFAYEFNKVAAGTELHVSGTMHGDVKEVLQHNRFREAEKTQTYFRAHISTRLYTLIVRGGNNVIDCFIMPVNHAMALSQLEKEYDPLATIEIKASDDNIVWRSTADKSSFNSLEDLCSWLFKELIEQTRKAIAIQPRG